MAWVRVATSSGSIAGNIAMRSWLRPSLRYGSVSTMPLARSAAAIAAASTSSSKSMVRGDVAALRRLGHERRARTCSPRPSRRAISAERSQRPPHHSSPPLLEHPLELVVEQEQRGERGRVVGLVEAGVLERDRQVERRRHPAVGRADAFDALDRGGRAEREPEPAVAGEALLRREVVDVELRRARRGRPPAPDVASTSTRPSSPRAAHVDHHAGRRLVVRVRVGVDGRRRRRARGGCRARTRSTIGSSRCGAARGDRRELRRELAEHEVLGCAARRGRTRRRPRTRCCRRCRAAPRSRRGARTGRRGRRGCCRTTERTPSLAVAGAEVAWRRRRRARAAASGRTFDGPGAEAPVAGDELGREG